MIIALTPGDPDGIGPELTWDLVKKNKIPSSIRLLCVGARLPFEKMKAKIVEVSATDLSSIKWKRGVVHLLAAPTKVGGATTASPAALAGFQSGWSVCEAVRLIQTGQVHALATGPISKERLKLGGYPYPGHTDLLAHLGKVPSSTMMLANSQLRVSLVTVHKPISGVSNALTPEKIKTTVQHTLDFLRKTERIKKPRILLTGLNPHCGENGELGDEEIKIIRPAIEALKKEWGSIAAIDGPFAADTLFAMELQKPRAKRCDAIVSMYHDQGLIPVKLVDFKHTVNISLGLPFIRTSVDHGVAFDLVGKKLASSASLEAAIKYAYRFRKGQDKKGV